MNPSKTYEQLVAENEQLRTQLEEATETIQAIRTGQIDAIVVESNQGHELYTLKTADQTYRVFIETMHEGAVTLNKQGLILYCNSSFASMVDEPLSSVIGSAFITYIAPLCRESYEVFFNQSWLAAGKTEMTLRQADNPLICLLSATPLVLDEGNCLSLILTDLTLQNQTQALLKSSNEQLSDVNAALVQTNQALNRSNDNLRQFAYVASHDLQEPLRKIQAFGDLLQMQYILPGSEAQDYLARMLSATSRMSTLIRDLLSYSRITTQPEAPKRISLNQVVNLALLDLELRIEESKASIEVGLLPVVVGDASQLQQLFQNLLSNSLKFQHPGVTPVIRLQADQVLATDLPVDVKPAQLAQSYHRIALSDNGIGFDEKHLVHIFQVFHRLHGKKEYAGTGIGLAICEKVVTNHGGAITARSKQGQGATFYVYLPC